MSALHDPARRPAGNRRTVTLVVIAVAVLVGVGFGFLMGESGRMPDVGDCLAGTDKDTFAGYDFVDCGDPRAVYEVAAKESRESVSGDVCRDYPDGEILNGTYPSRNAHKQPWAVCLVPVGAR